MNENKNNKPYDGSDSPKRLDEENAERQVEGVDFDNQTVTLPEDVDEAFSAHPELKAYFKQMSFSHKREYIEHIVSAKKPETRKSRIEKAISMIKAEMEKR